MVISRAERIALPGLIFTTNQSAAVLKSFDFVRRPLASRLLHTTADEVAQSGHAVRISPFGPFFGWGALVSHSAVPAYLLHSSTPRDDWNATWSKELDPYRELAGRTEDRGYPFGRGKLPAVEDPSTRISVSVLPGLADVPMRRLPELTPAWGPHRAAECNGLVS